MPTGYTADIGEKNITFKQFALRCMSAFVYDIRDNVHLSERPEELTVGTYHIDELKKAEERLKNVEKMNVTTSKARAEKEYTEKVKSNKEFQDKKDELKRRYLNILKQVKAWKPPTEKHLNYKQYLIEQLTISIDSDCYTLDPAEKLSGRQWKAKEIKDAKWHINYHTEKYNEECERVAGRNKWVNELCDSLEGL
jgi:predicted RNA-binding protein with RPS1 domain